MFSYCKSLNNTDRNCVVLFSCENPIVPNTNIVDIDFDDLCSNSIELMKVISPDSDSDDEEKKIKLINIDEVDESKNHYIFKVYTEKKKFKHEYNMIRKLDHPYIIKILQAYNVDHNYGFLLDYYSAGDLFEMGSTLRKYEPEILKMIFQKLAMAIQYCNDQGIIHADIKSENIMLNKKLEPILIDFEMAIVLPTDKDYIIIPGARGTMLFLSPEAMNEVRYSSKSDIWAYGIVVYENCIGGYPFDSNQVPKNKVYKYVFDVDGPEKIDGTRKFLSQILVENPDERLDWNAILKLDFLQLKDEKN
jgi:serine/threonine protein kinase